MVCRGSFAACERTYRFKNNSRANTYRGIHIPYRVAWPGDMLIAWSEHVGRQLRLLVDDDMDEELVEQGLYIKDSGRNRILGAQVIWFGAGEWADPELAAYFVFHLVERLPELYRLLEFVDFDDYWDWSANWWDRYKSSDFWYCVILQIIAGVSGQSLPRIRPTTKLA